MNRRLQDPQEAFNLPELLEDSLEEGRARCIAFNRLGTLLAVGLDDGKVAIWDFQTRSVARTSATHKVGVTCVAWSKDGRLLASAGQDGSLVLWNIEADTEVGRMQCESGIVSFSLGRKDPHICLVSLQDAAPQILNIKSNTADTLPVPQMEETGKGQGRKQDGVPAIFNHKGDLAFVALPRGLILVISAASKQIVDVVKVAHCKACAINVAISQNGKHLLVNYEDKGIRSFDIHPRNTSRLKNSTIDEVQKVIAGLEANSSGSLFCAKSPLVTPSGQVYQNRVEKSSWKCAAFSCDTEYVAAATGEKNEYKVYIWTRWARLDRILEIPGGQKEGLLGLSWHPCTHLLAVVTESGAVHLWAQVYKENWSAFAPDFTELQENEEYIEPEDVFDINPKLTEEATDAAEDMDVAVDLLTIDKAEEYDSDGEPLSSYYHHLPVIIQPQEFDENGKLVVPNEETDFESPAISGKSLLVPPISQSNGKADAKTSQGKHRLANVSLPSPSEGTGGKAMSDTDEEMLSD